MSHQLTISQNQVQLRIQKAPIIILSFLFILSGVMFLLPIVGMIFNLIQGEGIGIGSVIVAAIFFFLAALMLKTALWNSKGMEVLSLDKTKIVYQANYGWFKGAKAIIRVTPQTSFTSNPHPMMENSKCNLKISGEIDFECVCQLQRQELTHLIEHLNSVYKKIPRPEGTRDFV